MPVKRKWYWRNRGSLYQSLLTPHPRWLQRAQEDIRTSEQELMDLKHGNREKRDKSHNPSNEILDLNRKIVHAKALIKVRTKERRKRKRGWRGVTRVLASAPAYMRLRRIRTYVRAREMLQELDLLLTTAIHGRYMSAREMNRLDLLRRRREELEKIVRKAGISAKPSSKAKKK